MFQNLKIPTQKGPVHSQVPIWDPVIRLHREGEGPKWDQTLDATVILFYLYQVYTGYHCMHTMTTSVEMNRISYLFICSNCTDAIKTF